MSKGGITRRTFLRGAGGVAIALPWLQVMGCGTGGGGAGGAGGAAGGGVGRQAIGLGGFPKRFVVFFSANGTIPDAWKPTGGETDFQLSTILAPLEPYRSKLLIVDGVDMESSNHGPGDGHQKGMGHMLTGTELAEGDLFTGGNGELAGWAGGISVDQRIAKEIGGATKFPSLELGVQVSGATVWSRMSYLDANKPVPPENSPYAAFERIFGDLGADPFGVARRKAQRETVLDAVQADYQALSARLGKEDRQKLDAHLTAVREIEKRLERPGGELGGACQKPEVGEGLNLSDSANFPAIGRLQMDLLAMSLACDLTRVASLQWSNSVSNKRFTWLGIDTGHHDLSHEDDGNLDAKNKLVQINTWYAEQFAYLLGKLDSIPEGDGTLLDNTVVLWCNELGKGNSHTRMNAPFVLAGSGGGYFKTGRYLTYPGTVPHNNLLVSLLNAMDIPATTFGNPAYCSGPLPKLT